MATVGEGIMKLSPVSALAVVSAHSFVLFLFASQGLETFLQRHGLPTIPLVPVSSSQAIVGAVIGIGMLKRGRGIRWRVLGGIASSWAVTPIIAALISFISLFILQNVFEQQAYRPVSYSITSDVMARIKNFELEKKESNFSYNKEKEQRLSKIIDPGQELRSMEENDFDLSPSLIGLYRPMNSGRLILENRHCRCR
jgi:PiT family inorganic phosphate transporter